MRYGPDHKEKTRRRILDAAAVVFRRKGFEGGSVDDVMTEAGLTAGGFYAHFPSKVELFAEAMVDALKAGRVIRGADESAEGAERVRSIARKYLSRAHCAMIEEGCMMPPLLSELFRQSESTRRAVQNVLLEVAATLEPHLTSAGTSEDPDRAFAVLALMVGGMTLARAAADDDVANRILAACRGMLDATLGDALPGPGPKPRAARSANSTRKRSNESPSNRKPKS